MLTAAALTLALLAGSAGSAAATTHQPAKPSAPPKLARLGHGTFWECPSKTTEILIGVNNLDLRPGQILDVNFIVKNVGTTACNYVAPYAGSAPGPTMPTLQAGPCGSIGFQIFGNKHQDVWPGTVTFSCPALGFAQLQPGASVTGSGSWDQDRPTGTKRVPVGSYTLVVAGHFDFPLKIEAR